MFDSLGEKFEGVFRKLRGQKTLTEDNIKDALREVRMALLEADVNYLIVKEFIGRVREKAVGEQVIKGVDPAQQFYYIVLKELQRMMAGDEAVQDEDSEPKEGEQEEEPVYAPFEIKPGKENHIMLLGLQGAGKTTFSGKLALWLKERGHRPMLVACDIYRPAAIEQLKQVGANLNFPVFDMGTDVEPWKVVKEARKKANEFGCDTIIIDTAGRLHIDEVKIDELLAIRDKIKPDYTFLVADAMTGQDAVNSANTFNEQVGIDGVCLTKLDGDARGGAALSIKAVTGKPIQFVGVGEKSDDLERFHPKRVAQRILGMGDVESLVEKAQEAINEDDALELRDKLGSGKFSYNDFLKQMKMVNKMGSLKGLLGMLPGVGSMMRGIDNDQLTGEMKRVEAIVLSMTKKERADPELVKQSGHRRERIAKGSGHTLKQVNELVKQFEQMRSMMQQMSGGDGGGLGGLFGGGGPGPNAGADAANMSPEQMMMGGGPDPSQMPDMSNIVPGSPEHKKAIKQMKALKKMQKQARPTSATMTPQERRKLRRKRRKK